MIPPQRRQLWRGKPAARRVESSQMFWHVWCCTVALLAERAGCTAGVDGVWRLRAWQPKILLHAAIRTAARRGTRFRRHAWARCGGPSPATRSGDVADVPCGVVVVGRHGRPVTTQCCQAAAAVSEAVVARRRLVCGCGAGAGAAALKGWSGDPLAPRACPRLVVVLGRGAWDCRWWLDSRASGRWRVARDRLASFGSPPPPSPPLAQRTSESGSARPPLLCPPGMPPKAFPEEAPREPLETKRLSCVITDLPALLLSRLLCPIPFPLQQFVTFSFFIIGTLPDTHTHSTTPCLQGLFCFLALRLAPSSG